MTSVRIHITVDLEDMIQKGPRAVCVSLIQRARSSRAERWHNNGTQDSEDTSPRHGRRGHSGP